MMKIETLQNWDKSRWQAGEDAIRQLATNADQRASDWEDAAKALSGSWPSHAPTITPKWLDRATLHKELSKQMRQAADVVKDGIKLTEDCRSTRLNPGLQTVASMANVTHDEFGRCSSTLATDWWTRMWDRDAHRAYLDALTGTQLLRGALHQAENLDNQVATALARLSDLDVPNSADGPLDLTDEGLSFQAALNNQRGYGDCVTVATLISIAQDNPNFIREHMRWEEGKNGEQGAYVVTVYDFWGNPVDVRVTMDEVLKNGSSLPGSKDPTFVTVYETAIEKQFGDLDAGRTTMAGIQRVTGQRVGLVTDPSFADIQQALSNDPPGVVVTSTGVFVPENRDPSQQGVPQHAYAVRGFDDQGRIILSNPWGPDGGWIDGRYYPGELHLTEEEFHQNFGFTSIAKNY